jgi:hypothetical protein
MNYQKIYNEIIERAKSRGLNKRLLDGYFEKHHIIPKCLDGTNDITNLVLLTAREHFICHQLLWKTNKENKKLFLSYWVLSHCKKDNVLLNKICSMTSKQFEACRITNAKILSERLKGQQKSLELIQKIRVTQSGKKYSNETNEKKGLKGGKNPSAVKCSIKDINFDTLDDAVEYAIINFGLTSTQAHAKFTNPYEVDFIKHKDIIAPNSQKVSIDGIIFDSKTKAYYYAKNKYDVGNLKMMNRINSDEYPDWFLIEEK